MAKIIKLKALLPNKELMPKLKFLNLRAVPTLTASGKDVLIATKKAPMKEAPIPVMTEIRSAVTVNTLPITIIRKA